MSNNFRILFSFFFLLVIQNDLAAQSECIDGLADGQFPCDNIELWAHIERSEVASLFPGEGIVRHNDIWGWTDEASGREFVLGGRNNGVAFVEISDPSNPVYLGDLPFSSTGRSSRWRDIKTFENFAYVVADGAGEHGMQIFDLRELLDVVDAPKLFQESGHYDQIGSAHNIVVNESNATAYAVGVSSGRLNCGGAAHAISLTDPLNPQFSGCIQVANTGRQGTGYTHDAQCLNYQGPDTDHQNTSICILFSENAISIVDVDVPTNPQVISIIRYPLAEYTHQGWLSPDHTTLYADDELDELRLGLLKTRTLIFDLTDLDNPMPITEHEGRAASIDHNQYVRGGFLYQSNYTSGLTIWNVSDPSNLQLEGYFDTFPSDNEVNFNGSWSNYPFFPSGTIAVNDRDTGLFLLSTPTIDHRGVENGLLLQTMFPNPASERINLRYVSSESEDADLRLYNMLGQEVHRATLNISAGASYSLQIDLADLTPGAYILSISTKTERLDSKVVVQ